MQSRLSLVREIGRESQMASGSGLLQKGPGGGFRMKVETAKVARMDATGAADQFDSGVMDMDFMLDGEELESQEFPQEAQEAEVPKEVVAGWLPWGDIQDAILMAFIADSQEWGGAEMVALGKRLKTQMEELLDIVQKSDPQVWRKKCLDRLLEIERIRSGKYNWDRVEQIALAKMMHIAENSTLKLGELLAISVAANRATRRGPNGLPESPGVGGMSNNVQVNIFGQPAAEGTPELPGAGSLGTIKLNLSKRTVQQLSEEKTITADYERLSDRIEMLSTDDIKELTDLSEKKDEE